LDYWSARHHGLVYLGDSRMSAKAKALIVALVFAIGLGVGRYSNDRPASETRKVVSDVQKEQDKVTEKKTTIVKEPTGKTVTTIVEETHTVAKQETKTKSQDTIKASPQLQVSVLAGIDLKTGLPTYGVAASKQFIGPITLGVFGLTNRTVGVSIGMTF